MSQPYGDQPGYSAQPGVPQPGVPQPGYGATPPGYGYPQEHPQASTVQILGIVGIFVGICSFIAWYMGAQAKKEIEAGAPYQWGGALKTGYLLGKVFSIIAICLIALYLIFVIVGLVFLSTQ